MLRLTLVSMLTGSLTAPFSYSKSVHLQLDELVTLDRTHADEVAERAATIGYSPDGRPATIAGQTGIPE